ncbi:hypothetical protein [Streptomyces californicus]
MPEEPTTPESGGEPMTIAEICAEHRVSRQTLHRLRADPDSGFPDPVRDGRSTRLRYPRALVAQFFRDNPLQPGRRTDLDK